MLKLLKRTLTTRIVQKDPKEPKRAQMGIAGQKGPKRV